MKINHIAFIMDGNRRYAQNHDLGKKEGYKKGLETMMNIISYQVKYKLKETSFFALSSDNYLKRTRDELDTVLTLAKELHKNKEYRSFFTENKIHIRLMGDIPAILKEERSELKGTGKIAKELVQELEKVNQETDEPQFYVNIALHYDGHSEIVHAMKSIAQEIEAGNLTSKDVSQELIKNKLWFDGPAPEVIVRPGDAPRISGFMLWDSKYSELYLTKKLWPELDEEEFKKIVDWYSTVKRNFGV